MGRPHQIGHRGHAYSICWHAGPEGPQTCCTISEYAGPCSSYRRTSWILPGSIRPGPRATPRELVNYWSQVPMGDWPRGMRNNMGQLPDPNNPGELGSPDTDDVMAQRILSDAMPPRRHRDTSTKIARLRYSNMFVNLFSIPGLYRAIISHLGAPLGHRIRDGFPFDTRNMDLSHVALWLHDHGLSPDSLELRQIETWALRVRAISDHRSEDGNWSSFPCNLEDVETGMFEQLNSMTLTSRTHREYPLLLSLLEYCCRTIRGNRSSTRRSRPDLHGCQRERRSV